jgi:hypothetical protein
MDRFNEENRMQSVSQHAAFDGASREALIGHRNSRQSEENMPSYPVTSRVAVIDRGPFPVLQRVPVRPAAMPPAPVGAGSVPEVASDPRRALIACGLWLHVGLIGALCAAAGLVLFVSGDMATLPAVCVAISGGATALLGWRRGRSVLEQCDPNLRARPEFKGR